MSNAGLQSIVEERFMPQATEKAWRAQPTRPDRPVATQNELKLAIEPRLAEPKPGWAAHINCAAKTIEPPLRRLIDSWGDGSEPDRGLSTLVTWNARAGARRHAVRMEQARFRPENRAAAGRARARLATDSLPRGAAHWHCLVGQRAHAAAPGDLMSGLDVGTWCRVKAVVAISGRRCNAGRATTRHPSYIMLDNSLNAHPTRERKPRRHGQQERCCHGDGCTFHAPARRSALENPRRIIGRAPGGFTQNVVGTGDGLKASFCQLVPAMQVGVVDFGQRAKGDLDCSAIRVAGYTEHLVQIHHQLPSYSQACTGGQMRGRNIPERPRGPITFLFVESPSCGRGGASSP